jgi:hypothetical protein
MTCCIPITRVAPAGHPNQVVDIDLHGTSEFFQAGMFGTFGAFHRHVQLTVGGLAQTQVILTAYDVNGRIVGQASAQLTPTQPVTLVAASASPNIAFFSLQTEENNQHPWVDDLTFDDIAAGDPNFTFGAPGDDSYWLTRGGAQPKDLPINRFNGSDGDITLSAAGLPQGVTATFMPNPVPGVDLVTSLTLSAIPDAPLIRDWPIKLTAIPAGPAVGKDAREQLLNVNVFPQFTVWVSDQNYELVGCAPTKITDMWVNKNAPFTGEVTLELRQQTASGATSELPSWLHASFDPPVSAAGLAFTGHDLMITADPGQSVTDLRLVVQARSGSLVATSPLSVHPTPAGIEGVFPSQGKTPQSLQEGTFVSITGRGFCPGLKVQFGNLFAKTDPQLQTSTEIRAIVPRLATTGPIRLLIKDFFPLASSDVFTVDSYRNTAGFSFKNYTPDITFDQMTTAFGENQTYINIPVCIIDCDWPVRNPLAMLLNAIANQTFSGSSGGACFGFSLSVRRLLAGLQSRSDFAPPGAQTNLALVSDDAHGGPSGPLREYINSQQVTQLGLEFLGHYLDRSLAQSSGKTADILSKIKGDIRDALLNDEQPMIAIRDGSGGHVVLAYDLEEGGSGDCGSADFCIYVYDPNVPFVGEDSNGATHDANVMESRIQVTDDGRYSLVSTPFNGAVNEIIVTKASQIPLHPTMPGSLESVAEVAAIALFASLGPNAAGQPPSSRTVQLTDTTGRTLFGPGGILVTDPGKRLPATPFPPFVRGAASTEGFLAKAEVGPIFQTVVGGATGPDRHVLVTPTFAGQIDTMAIDGVADKLAFDAGGGVGFQTQANQKSLTASIMARTESGLRSAELRTTSRRAVLDEFRFDRDRVTLLFQHGGLPEGFRLRLSSVGKHAQAVAFDSGPLQIGAKEAASFSPSNWMKLDSVTMTVRGSSGLERREVLPNRLATKPMGRIMALDVDDRVRGVPRARVLEIASRLDRLSPNTQVTLAWTVGANGRVVVNETRNLRAAEIRPGLRRDRYIFYAPEAGKFIVSADLRFVTTEGVIQISQSSSRSAHVLIR